MRSVFYSSAVQGLPAQGTQVSSHWDKSCSSNRWLKVFNLYVTRNWKDQSQEVKREKTEDEPYSSGRGCQKPLKTLHPGAHSQLHGGIALHGLVWIRQSMERHTEKKSAGLQNFTGSVAFPQRSGEICRFLPSMGSLHDGCSDTQADFNQPTLWNAPKTWRKVELTGCYVFKPLALKPLFSWMRHRAWWQPKKPTFSQFGENS